MALPAYPNAISLGLVNTELGYASSIQSITLNDAAVRALFVKSSGAIAMSDGHGKSAAEAPAFSTTVPVNFAGGGFQDFLVNNTTANRSVNDRTWGYWNVLYMVPNAVSANATATITFPEASGGGITYEWQFLTWNRFHPTTCTEGQRVPLVASAQTWNGPSGYNDSISGASTNSLTMTGYAYRGTAASHSVAGYWRLKASNSAGATYTAWIQVAKQWGYYTYSCNCVCPEGEEYTYECNCGSCSCPGGYDCDCQYDESVPPQPYNCQCCGEESCTCDTCNACYVSEECDACDAYSWADEGDYSACGW